MAPEISLREERPIAKVLAGVAHQPGAPKPTPILVVSEMRRAFGGLVAVDVEHLEIQKGSVTALIGPNGSGKTTLFNLLCGFDAPDEGQWQFFGSSKVDEESVSLPWKAEEGRTGGILLRGKRSHEIARLGMVRTFQLTRSLSLLTVLENVLLAATDQAGERLSRSLGWAWRRIEKENKKDALEILERFGLAHMSGEYAGSLSGGQRKLLELARAVMARPSLLLLDEPLAGVNPALVESILERMLEFPGEGMTILFVEHSMDVVMSISDWVVCLGEGSIISEGPPEVVAQDPLVIDAYLGKEEN